MKRKHSFLAALLAIAMTISLAGCDLGGQESTASPEPSPSASASSQEPSSADSSQEEESSTNLRDEETSPENGSDASSQGEHTGLLPEITTGDTGFDQKFAQNPLDTQYAAQMENASSTGQMIGVNSQFIELWKTEVDAAYKARLEKAPENQKDSIRTQQEEWVSGTGSAMEGFSSGKEGSAGQLETSGQILLYYRERAAELYVQLYAIDPDFSFQYQG